MSADKIKTMQIRSDQIRPMPRGGGGGGGGLFFLYSQRRKVVNLKGETLVMESSLHPANKVVHINRTNYQPCKGYMPSQHYTRRLDRLHQKIDSCYAPIQIQEKF